MSYKNKTNHIYNPPNKKTILLEIAKNGEKKPHWKTKLGKALSNYINKSNASYDPEFNKQIKTLRPDWFIKTSDTNTDKTTLLQMAKNGEKKPIFETKLGNNLSNYTWKCSNSYDPEFDKELRTIRPDWLEKTSNTNKIILLQKAKNGGERPSQKTKLGRALSNYTIKSSGSYDPEFDKEIRTLRPNWFENTSDIKKNLILQKVKKGEKRPSRKTKLGQALSNYISKNNTSYDPEFDKTIRTLSHDWFVSRSDIANQKKNQILEIAKNGRDRPSRNTELGKALADYIKKNGSSYDLEFNKQIKTLRPDWFRNKIINN